MLVNQLENLELKILLVDDEEDMVDLLKSTFDGLGHETETAYSGDEALEKFSTIEVDAVLTDYSMPDMNGVELAKELKKIRNNIKVILYTGYESIELEDRNFFFKIFQKPVLSLDIAKMVEEIQR